MPDMVAKEWFAVYTKPRWEKKVYASLSAKGILAYCPINKVVRQWSDRKKTVEVPLFASYVFVCILPEEQLSVRMTAGVVNFVYWLGNIARIRPEEMEQLRAFVSQNGNILLERLDYRRGDIFQIDAGPFKGQQAAVTGVHKNKLELILKSMNVRLVVSYNKSGDEQPLS